MLKAAAAYHCSDAELPMRIAILDNEIDKGDYNPANEIPIYMSDSENTAHSND